MRHRACKCPIQLYCNLLKKKIMVIVVFGECNDLLLNAELNQVSGTVIGI